MARKLSETSPLFPLANEGNRFLSMHSEKWELDDGKEETSFKYTTGETGNTALVVAFTPEMQIVVISEFQPVVNPILSCIGCGMKRGEDPRDAGLRGLREKTGYHSPYIEVMTTFVKDSRYTNGTLTILMAGKCVKRGEPAKGVTVVVMDPYKYRSHLMHAFRDDPMRPHDGMFTSQGVFVVFNDLRLL